MKNWEIYRRIDLTQKLNQEQVILVILILMFVVAESLLVPYLTYKIWCFFLGGC